MRGLAITIAIMAVIASLAPSLDGQQGPPPRLIVDNRSGSEVQIHVWRFNGNFWEWSVVARVAQGHWIPIYYVSNGDQYRAILPKATRYHTVQLRFDNGYQGMQGVWWVE